MDSLTIFDTQREDEKRNWRSNSSFGTNVMCNRYLCSMLKDGESCINIVTEDGIKKLDIKTEPHPDSQKLLVNNTNLVSGKIGRFIDRVQFDVLCLKGCHC